MCTRCNNIYVTTSSIHFPLLVHYYRYEHNTIVVCIINIGDSLPHIVPSVVDREKFQQVFHLVATVCQLNKEISEKSSIDESNVIWNASIRLESIMKRLRMGRIRAGVVGLTKAGKSTTLNALLGKQFLPGSVQPQTAKEVSIVHTTGTDGELYGVKGEKRIPLGTGHQSIHDRLVKFNNESRKDKHIGYDTLYLHAPLTFLANKVQSVQFELSDTPGLGEAGSEQFSFESELAVRDMCAFVVIMKLDFLKTKTESELLLSLSTLHPKLFTNLNRILILINAYELSHRDKSKHNLQADKIQGYVSNYLREPNVLGKDIPHKHIITFSALWGLRARLWLANPEFLLDGTDARNLYNEALIELDRAGYDVQLLRGERTIEKVHNLSLLLEDFSHIKHVESNLTQMLHDNGASVLLESSVDDVLSVVDTIRTEISQMVIKENVTKKEKVVDNARYLLTSYKQTVEKYLNISTDLDDYIEASMRATLNTLAASLEESLNSLVNNKLYETLRGTVENEEKNHVQSRILSARSSILSPATTRMKMEWLRVVESIRRAIVEQLKVILSDLKLELVSGFSDDIGQSLLIDEEIIKKSHEVATLSSEMLNGLYDVAVSFLPPQSDGMDFELSYDGQGSEKVTDTALTQRLVQGKKTKYNMKSEKMCFGRRYVFAGPKDCVRYNVAEPYDVTTYSPDFVGLQSDFSEVVNGWIGRFTTQVNEHRSNVCETVASKFKSAVETALMLPVQQLEEDLQWKEAALKQSTHNVEYLKTKKEELNKEEMKLEEFLIDSRRE